jgi:hypothetical protein
MRHLARVHVPQLDLFRPAAGLVATPGGNAREGSAPDDAPATRAKERTGSTAGAGARVLITSRFSDWSELADEVALDVLPEEMPASESHGTWVCWGADACGRSWSPTTRSRPCGGLLQADFEGQTQHHRGWPAPLPRRKSTKPP